MQLSSKDYIQSQRWRISYSW